MRSTPPSTFFLGTAGTSLLLAGFFLTQQPLWGQAQEAPKYTAEEYKAYQEATGETHPVKKVALIVQFLKDRPQSTLRDHLIAAYQGQMNEFQSGQKWAELVAAGESYLTVVPDDIFTASLLATAYQQTKNLKQFVIYGEKVFEKDPTKGNTAYYLAKAYLDLKNDPKFLYWGEKTVALLPDNHDILLDLTKKFAEAKKNAQASRYARMCIKAMQAATKPAEVADKTWKDYNIHVFATCYYVVGHIAFEQQDYNTAVSNLESSLRHYGRNDRAYYYLGQAYWQQAKLDLAMKSFAKAYLLKGPTSAPSKQHLDNLYRSTHGNSLVGLERVIAKAQEELR